MSYCLRFNNLVQPGRGFSFPCDEHGVVRMSELTPAMIRQFEACRGRNSGYSVPVVEAETAESGFGY